MFWTTTKPSQIFVGVLLGALALGTTAEKASAVTPLDLIQIPLNAVGGGSPKPLPNRNIDVFKENMNGNNLNLCVSPGPCQVPGSSPRVPTPRPTSIPQVRGPIAPPRVPQRVVAPSQAAPRQTAAPQSAPGAVLSIPQIELF